MRARLLFASGLAVLTTACGAPPATGTPTPQPTSSPVAVAKLDRIGRADFNRLAPELALPLFWIEDAGNDGVLTAAELAILWGIDDTQRGDWIADGELTPKARAAYDAIVASHQGSAAKSELGEAERKRRDLVREELAQGRATLIHNDFRDASAEDKAIVQSILRAARIIERLHAKQLGSWALRDQLAADDPASKMLFYRNQGPWCVAPSTETNAACTAIAGAPKKVSGLYPASLQQDEKFCESLEKHADAKKLRHQFHVVKGEGDKLEAVPYHVHYADDVKQVSAELKHAAAAIQSPGEAPFKKYLLAAAQAFLDDNWEPADEAWAAMNVNNSKWYLRIGPDEVYYEPCSTKAGFHVSFAKINQDSLAWQKKLDPVKGEMEKALAQLAGKPYAARDVSFQLPDFIDIVLNAGDSRSALGATIGQSLPNWGPVANEGRGRTVAMTNIGTDADSRAALETQAQSMLCPATMTAFTSAPAPQVMGTVLHEAAHNLGPSHEYRVDGKKATEIFGGPLASMLEELKAQTAALYFTDWLLAKKLVSQQEANQAHVRDITWTFGHISRGMYDAQGRGRSYSQLSAIQVGYLVEHGAAEWKADAKAANGQDTGCLELHLDKFPAQVAELMKDVAGIKARGDKAGALELKKRYVDVDGEKKKLHDTIRDRWLRAPKASYVYSVDL